MSTVADDNFEFQKIIVILGFTLLIIKYVAYALTGSVAIFTDATESIVNVVAACIGIYALYLSAQPADRGHPFGHGKVEVISSAIEGAMIVMAGVVIVYETIQSFISPGEITDQLDIGLVLVALAAVANFVVGRAAIAKGRRNRSPALEASGRHLCSDTYSSVGILAGLVVVYAAQSMGYDARWLDSSIAGLFGMIIIATGARVIKRAMDDAMDAADGDLIGQITETINEYRHDDWIDVYSLRVIKYGPSIYVNLRVVLPRDMTVEEMDQENREIDEAIRSRFGDSVETSIVAVPCVPFYCRSCQRNCLRRTSEYDRSLEWNPDMLSTPRPHAIDHFVRIEDPEQNR